MPSTHTYPNRNQPFREFTIIFHDETGAVQPTRAALMAARGAQFRYHYNAIQSWSVAAGGAVSNVYV